MDTESKKLLESELFFELTPEELKTLKSKTSDETLLLILTALKTGIWIDDEQPHHIENISVEYDGGTFLFHDAEGGSYEFTVEEYGKKWFLSEIELLSNLFPDLYDEKYLSEDNSHDYDYWGEDK